MVSPFSIDEIFPDVGAGSVRLPRRQAGSSPQGLAVTLVADYTLPARAWLPSAAIVALLGEFGVTDGAARTTISRLARRRSAGGLPARAAHLLPIDAAGQREPLQWRHAGRVVRRDPPSPGTARGRWSRSRCPRRRAPSGARCATNSGGGGTRRCTTGMAFASSADVTHGTDSGSDDVRCDDRVPRAAHGPRGGRRAQPGRRVGHRRHRRPVQAVHRPLERTAGRDHQAQRVRCRGGETPARGHGHLPATPAHRPAPARWTDAIGLATAGGEVFIAVYDGLAQPAEEHVRAVVASVGDAPGADVRAHTVEEMAAGICDTPA